MSPTSLMRCLDSEEVSSMSRKAFRIQTTCQRCCAKQVDLRRHVTDVVHQVPGFRRGVTNVAKGLPDSDDVSQMSRQGAGFTRRVDDVKQSTSGLRRHVTDVAHEVPGFRRGVTSVAKGLPDSDDVSPMPRKARSG
ncbi:unnamed protein product [Heligmosomoides polygyrus]|uniref:C2H2-type domain-containing protein n=1 Tax=Heligmosomoides polygyrus TaxID=6339 RepID=A0A183GVN7_HELPZ|nr:unnamed protein product [Heligmosomoides polygyrus]